MFKVILVRKITFETEIHKIWLNFFGLYQDIWDLK